nr:hypothetical protein [Erwinia sp. Ejp617]
MKILLVWRCATPSRSVRSGIHSRLNVNGRHFRRSQRQTQCRTALNQSKDDSALH